MGARFPGRPCCVCRYFGSLPVVLLPLPPLPVLLAGPPLLGLFGVAAGALELEPEQVEPLAPELEEPEVPPVPLEAALNSLCEMRPSLSLSSSLKRPDRALSSFSSSRDRWPSLFLSSLLQLALDPLAPALALDLRSRAGGGAGLRVRALRMRRARRRRGAARRAAARAARCAGARSALGHHRERKGSGHRDGNQSLEFHSSLL